MLFVPSILSAQDAKWEKAYRSYTVNVNIDNDDTVTFDYEILFKDSTDSGSFKCTSLDTFLFILENDLLSLPKEKNDILYYFHGMFGGQPQLFNYNLEEFRNLYLEPEGSSLARIIGYRWPGNLPSYEKDKRNAKTISEPVSDRMDNLMGFIRGLDRSIASNVMTHSLGSELFKDVVAIQHKNLGTHFTFDQIVLAAPDLDVDVFTVGRPLTWLASRSNRITTYFSTKDLTLTFSKKLNKKGRLGVDGPSDETLAMANVSYVDMTAVKDEKQLPLRITGHTYLRASALAASDILQILVGSDLDQMARRELIDKTLNVFRFLVTERE